MTRPSKYKAQRTNGYASKLEARHAARLKMLMNAKDPKERVVEWIEQVKTPLRAPLRRGSAIVGHYVCDFVVKYADGHIQWEEVKGLMTPLAKWKLKHFQLEYPDRKLVIVTK